MYFAPALQVFFFFQFGMYQKCPALRPMCVVKFNDMKSYCHQKTVL